jgi:hypothetical protein
MNFEFISNQSDRGKEYMGNPCKGKEWLVKNIPVVK